MVVLKSWAKAFLTEYKRELKSLFQWFYCIHVLFKTLVENYSTGVAKVKVQKKDKKKAVSENSILAWRLVSLLIFAQFQFFYEKMEFPLTHCRCAVSALSACLKGHWTYHQSVWGVAWLFYCISCCCHALGSLMPSTARMWLCALYEVTYLSTRNRALRLWICYLHEDEWSQIAVSFGHCHLLLVWSTLSLKTFQASYKSQLYNRFGLEDGWDAPGSHYVSRVFPFISLPSWKENVTSSCFFFRWLLDGVYLHSVIFVTGQLILNLIRFRELRPFK